MEAEAAPNARTEREPESAIGLLSARAVPHAVTRRLILSRHTSKTRRDLRSQVARGMKVSIRGSRYLVSTDPDDEFSEEILTLDRKVAELSVNDQV